MTGVSLHSGERRFRVFMVPSAGNPYVETLTAHLSRLGVDVLAMPQPLTRQWLEANRFEPRSILHFHWPSYSYTAQTRSQTADLIDDWLRNIEFARKIGYCLVWTVHNLYPHDCHDLDLQHRARCGLIRNCSAIIGHCRNALAEVERTFGATNLVTSVIPHGNYIGTYGEPFSADEAREILGMPQHAFLFLFFGLIRPYKGIEALIAGMGDRSNLAVELLIAGRPCSTSYARQLIAATHLKEHVHFHPFYIPCTEVPVYFGAANAVVLPYSDVLSSGATILAHSMARPVIAPAIGCLPEMVPPGTGWLYDPRDAAGLRDAMQHALVADRIETGKRCLSFAEAFTWDAVAAATRCVYARAAADWR
jgi:beta-1,4-mannosyltransferase